MKKVLIAVLAFSLFDATAAFAATKHPSSHSKSQYKGENKRSKGQKGGYAKSKPKVGGHAKPMAKAIKKSKRTK